ncbi:hypothetical protein J14TS2_47040 [Bacillus sp. J14TS2]|uniref:hypothetical protein n=1 Tax=Bacillus sp. J14TS2 TaxID=2807188 RepID=UPI001B25D37C|nr:hypothetical protein [Bacillus sp. J14TS2]GIN74229.1 hypothetical protein J14TS2_47040 [Bacillus sp. J14TS2]
MLNVISDYWSKPMVELISELCKEPERSSNGRRRLEHQRIFEGTLAQYEFGDIFYLEELTDDPII